MAGFGGRNHQNLARACRLAEESMKLNVEHVMSQVRGEVIRRGGTFAINEEPLDTGGEFPFWRPAVPQVEIKPAYRLSELLRYSDRAFVENAYLAVLRRLPDPDGNEL